MLIDDEIQRLCDHRLLFPVESLEWRGIQERAIYVSADVHRFLTEASSDPTTNAERRKLQRLFDRFISGQEIAVAFTRNIKASDIKRLSRKAEEVWEFKVRTTRPQLRIFGRFAQKDVFLALTGPADRPYCDYGAEIIRCQQKWNELLPGRPPIHGDRIDDYISAKGIPL